MKLSFKVKSPANIALIKYWGRNDEDTVMPNNTSISLNLSDAFTTSEFFYGDFSADSYEFDGDTDMALKHIVRVRDFFMKRGTLLPFVEVKSENSFPTACGIASSASSMSALTFGLFELARRFGGKFENSDLVEMTRLSGSASAVRSLGKGIVVYDPDRPSEFEQNELNMDLVDVVCLVDSSEKKVSSYSGHLSALSSYLYEDRIQNIDYRAKRLLASVDANDFYSFGEVVEEEAISFLLNHYTTDKRMQYLYDKSLELIYMVKSQGVNAYFTFDAGCNPHFIMQREDVEGLNFGCEVIVNELNGAIEIL